MTDTYDLHPENMVLGTAVVHIEAGSPDLTVLRECADCGFDAVVTIPIVQVHDDGVTPVGSIAACLRCAEEDDDAVT